MHAIGGDDEVLSLYRREEQELLTATTVRNESSGSM
jgi:hypothetical protein